MKFFLKGILFIVMIGHVLVSCKKENIVIHESPVQVEQTANEEKFTLVNPENSNNAFDDFGAYFKTMILDINQSELETQTPSSTEIAYTDKYISYMENNPNPVSYAQGEINYSELFIETTQLVIDNTVKENVNDAILGLQEIENNIVNSSEFTPNQKNHLLCFTSAMKYSRHTIADHELTVDGITVDGGLYLKVGCFDQAFSSGVHAVYSNFVDTENPGNMVAAWAGFGVTIVAGLGNGFYHGIKDCW